ncbi:MAG TPA: epoxide hydrolase [Acidimicrobiales bacterium]|jgi:pimeloyl-ACP methyl ester carboxylesterase|nr:epoxide hydrolase [Acidimicrobiales bacterium]
MSETVETFRVDVDDSVLQDLDDRLGRTRFPDQIEGTGWEYGIPVDYLQELVEYWRHTYDWRSQEARLNELAHFRTTIDRQQIHFIHARSHHVDAMPILLTHGWPGSVVEFQDVIPRLTDPEAYGGEAADAFHVVVPSLPGYGFSEPPRTPGWDVRRIAQAFVVLMSRLGYGRYMAQGGDWGAQVTTRIGVLDPEHCAAIHLNMPIGTPSKDGAPLTEVEEGDLAAMQRFQREEAGYANEQGTKPQTLGVSLNDSPAGLLAWIVEKFRAWSDCDGHPENCFTRDQLLTNVMLYWATQTATSSARLYWERNHGDALAEPPPFITVPTGVARYPKEILRWPRSWVERQYNVTHWADMPRGGHFAAMEQPELFVGDLRQFFATVRGT